MSTAGGFGVETRGTIAAAQNPLLEIGAGQRDMREYSSKERPHGTT